MTPEIQKLIDDTKKQAPYQIREVWSKMPDTFEIDYTQVPEDIRELYRKYCY